MKRVLVIHGPNLNLLGKREQDVYGTTTLEEINSELKNRAGGLGLYLEVFQSNEEGKIVSKIQEAKESFDALLINPAAHTHYSIAIRDAIVSLGIPVVEIHLSNIFSREDFRKKSVVSPVVSGVISGFGKDSYLLAIEAAANLLKD